MKESGQFSASNLHCQYQAVMVVLFALVVLVAADVDIDRYNLVPSRNSKNNRINSKRIIRTKMFQ